MSERREKVARDPASAAALRVGVWSRKGEFLGIAEIPAGWGGGAPEHPRFSAGRDPGEEGMAFTAHRFPGGYRVRIREWWAGGEEVQWLAPVEEGEEGYMGLFSEEEVREVLPHLGAPLETPGGLGAGTNAPRAPEPGQG